MVCISDVEHRAICELLPASTMQLATHFQTSRFSMHKRVKEMAVAGILKCASIKGGKHTLTNGWEKCLAAVEDEADIGTCEQCGAQRVFIMKFQKKRICENCLNPDYETSIGREHMVTNFPVDLKPLD